MYSFVYNCGIQKAEILSTFKIRFKLKCTDSNMPTALEILRIVYLSSLSVISLTFETFPLPVTVTGRSSFAASLTNCAFQVFLSPPMNWLVRYLIRPINFPWFCKNLHYHKTEFCANFYKGANFFNILNLFANQFYNSGQRLTLLK